MDKMLEHTKLGDVFDRIVVCTEHEGPLGLEDDISELAKDSLDYILAIQNIEKEFGIHIPDEEVVKFRKIGDLAVWLEDHS